MNQDDERWIEICEKWNAAHEILKVIEEVVTEYESRYHLFNSLEGFE